MTGGKDPEQLLLAGSLGEIGAALRARRFSSVEMAGWYKARIDALDRSGPALNAVRALAPQAEEAAARLDAELAAGRDRGPLHGIPILLKDNILTADGLPAAAGSLALSGFVPHREATIVGRLRAAGAIILGKTNMTEFADYVSDIMPAEFSGAGGVVRNPHGLRYGRGQGSSVGSAAAVAAALVPVAIGTETQNSLQTPACHSSVVAFKPSVGAVSRSGIVPLVPSQDSPGPLARSVADAALVLAAIAGRDSRDTATLGLERARWAGLRGAGLAGVRIGVPRRAMAERAEFADVLPLFEAALTRLAQAGAALVDPCDLPSAEQLQDMRSAVFRTEFKAALDGFLADHGAPGGIASLAGLIAWNERHPEAIPYGQPLLLAAQETLGLDDPRYLADRARDLVLSRTAGIDAALAAGAVDVLMVPMGAAAKATGKAGAPVVALPLGLDGTGTPFGVSLFAAPGSDAKLLSLAAAIEQAVGDRRLPAI